MSTTTTHLTTPPAPWSATFQSHLSKLPSPEFVLSTLHPSPHSPAGFLPRARYCIYRGMFATLPENKHNAAEQNPPVYESDMPTFTTDVRMQKVGDFFSTGRGKAVGEVQMQGSGGGGPVEAVWWVKDTGTQWRVRGTAWVVGNDIEDRRGDVLPGAVSSGVRAVKAEVGRRMRIKKGMEGREGEWSWGRELRAHFGNVSPGMRGTWRNPPPGQPTDGKEPEGEEKLGQMVEDLDDERARGHFRVVVIRPDEVEQTDISDPETARRWLYTFVVKEDDETDKGEWKVQELWP